MIQLKPSAIIAIIVAVAFLILGGMWKIQDYRNDILETKLKEMNVNVQVANENVVKIQSQLADIQRVQVEMQSNRIEHTNNTVQIKEVVKVVEKTNNKEAELILNQAFNNIASKINES
ncbi:PseT.2 conserved hypothetical protein [Acinetobacter phage 133]|uniref:Uncharacterized protein n=1 Tax=Acinetobacter phage 133 TaxID=2919552 RepID=D9I6F9_9CAUD|nr:PseT.2 conserved hypothetical protein [Acinetobacter phage 133]ADJ19540.1 PseT.2 conserved hypothetical protein [Acinetobacter phage 133]